MRWKLLIIASLLAALAGAGASIAAFYFLLAEPGRVATPGWAVALTLLFPLAATTYASIFVYRHTSRRRALQATATALLALFLTLAALFIFSVFSGRRTPRLDPVPPNPFARLR